jgi:hypothetical protein
VVLAASRVVRALDARDRLARIAASSRSCRSSWPARRRRRSCATGWTCSCGGRTGGGARPLLAALLKAAGERASLDYARDLVFVKVEIDPADARRLPPHAALIVARRRARLYLPLWVRHARTPLGFLPRSTREGLARRRFIA